MIIVGLTGGIGSGKTTVAKEFNLLGVPVFIADEEAKNLMRKSKVIKRKLIQLFGNEAYINGELNKPFLGNIIFNDPIYLRKMNAIVHPKVALQFDKWVKKQTSTYIIKEVAILFESGGYKLCDYVITVTANKALRIERLLKRDQTTKEKIEAIMKNQWPEEKKIKNSDYVINNVSLANTKNQILKIHSAIIKKADILKI